MDTTSRTAVPRPSPPTGHRPRARLALLAAFAVLSFVAVGCLPAAVPGAPPTVTAAPADGAMKLTWAKPASAWPPVTGYVVTPAIGAVSQAPITFPSTATTATVTGLANGTSYTFTVAAINNVGAGPASPPSTPVIVGTPSAPAFITAHGYDRVAELTWWPPLANGSSVSGYAVTPYLGGVAQPTQTFDQPGNRQYVNALTNGLTYTFAVAAVNAFGTGPASMSAPTRIGVPPASPAPTADPGATQATIRWSAPDGYGMPIVGYTITLTAGGVAQPPEALPPSTTSKTYTGLTSGTTYVAAVSATSDLGTSNPGTVTFVPGTPGAPRDVAAVSSGNFSAVVSWTPPPDNGSPITAYLIAPYLGSVNQPATKTYPATETSQEINGLNCSCLYTFQVTAINAHGTGGTAITAPIWIGAPPAPTQVSAQPGDGTATVSWTAPVIYHIYPVVSYVVTPYIGTVAQPERSFDSTATTQVVTGLTNGTDYTFRVQASNYFDAQHPHLGPASLPTAPIRVGTPTAPATPSAVGGSGQATVSWAAPAANAAPITAYVITPFANGVARPSQTFDASATTRTLTGLTNGTTYRFGVAATNAVGTGPRSTLSAPVTPA